MFKFELCITKNIVIKFTRNLHGNGSYAEQILLKIIILIKTNEILK